MTLETFERMRCSLNHFQNLSKWLPFGGVAEFERNAHWGLTCETVRGCQSGRQWPVKRPWTLECGGTTTNPRAMLAVWDRPEQNITDSSGVGNNTGTQTRTQTNTRLFEGTPDPCQTGRQGARVETQKVGVVEFAKFRHDVPSPCGAPSSLTRVLSYVSGHILGHSVRQTG